MQLYQRKDRLWISATKEARFRPGEPGELVAPRSFSNPPVGVRSRRPAVHGETSSSTFPLVSTAKKKQTSAPITAATAQARKTPLKP